MATMRETLYDYCQKRNNTVLLWQWDPVQNGDLTPEKISYGSKQKVWWRCEDGHRWQASVTARTCNESGCPYCMGRRPIPGENDLAHRHPELVAQWHPTKNGSLRPDQILPGSQQRAWWICEKGHVWSATVKSRVSGCGCPVCANREAAACENDLATTHPLLAAQWHPTRNGTLTPRDLVAGTHKKVWWLCEKGHAWQASVVSRTSGGTGCPVCTGRKILAGENDLASQFPKIAAQWHPSNNGALLPQQVAPTSNRRVWWLCELGHSYQAAVSARTMHGSGCPYCAGKRVLAGFNDLATLRPELASQWEPSLNGTLRPEMVTCGSHRKVWWQCPEGHVWKAMICSRAGPQKCGCPVCAGKAKRRRPCYLIQSDVVNLTAISRFNKGGE